MAKRVRTLLRVSSRQQLHDDDIPLQRAEAEQYIALQPDWTWDGEYVEKAVSAYKNKAEDREILKKILSDARKKEFDILLAYMSDRIGRKEEYSAYVAALNEIGIEVWTIKDGQLKTEEHIDKLLNFIRFWQNEGESRKTSMRVRDAQREMAAAGKFTGGNAPFGYRLILSGEISSHGRALHKLEVVPEDAAVVKKIYSLAIHQGMGAEKIAKTLNREGIDAISADGWKCGTVSGILKNPVYMGYPAVGRRVNHGSCHRIDCSEWTYAKEQQPELVIIPKEDWERAQEIREARKKKQGGIPFSTSGRLCLIGIAYCGYCGKRLKNASYNNRWYSKKEGKEKSVFVGRYQCPNRCRERFCYSQDYLEGIVLESLAPYLNAMKPIDISAELGVVQKQRKKLLDKELQSLKKQQKTISQDITTLNEHIPRALRKEHLFSAEKLAELIRTKEEKLQKIGSEIQEKEREIQDIVVTGVDDNKMKAFMQKFPGMKEILENSDISTKRMLLTDFIERIEVKDDDIKIRFRMKAEDYIFN